MLYVRTIIKESNIEGLGLFAAEYIKKGTLVAKWNPAFDREFSDEEVDSFHEPNKSLIKKFGWRARNGKIRMSLDNSRHTNHSKTPNLIVTPNDDTDEVTAARDIESGEELTEDYSAYDLDFELYAHELK